MGEEILLAETAANRPSFGLGRPGDGSSGVDRRNWLGFVRVPTGRKCLRGNAVTTQLLQVINECPYIVCVLRLLLSQSGDSQNFRRLQERAQ